MLRSALGRRIVRHLGRGLAVTFLVSIAISTLLLALPIYSLQVFDRVLPSGHLETLILLSLALVLAVATMAALDAVRASLLNRMGTRLADRLASEILAAMPSRRMSAGQALRELDQIKQTVTGPPAQALFDLPWLPTALVVTAVLHPTLAWFALGSAVLLAGLGWLNHAITRRRTRAAHDLVIEAQTRADAISSHADVIAAMGMLPQLVSRFRGAHRPALLMQQGAGEAGGWVGAAVRACRLLVQSAVLGVGVWLVVRGELSAGGMIAGSILTARALAPIEQLLAGWRAFAMAAQSLEKLDRLLGDGPSAAEPLRLPEPVGRLDAEALVVTAPGKAVLKGVSVTLQPGTIMGLIGPSAAGKSTLCRVLAGCAVPDRGTVRLDGAELHRIPAERRGPHVGYLPQEPGLFAGSVAANIARMAVEPDHEAVVAAARLAGVHDMILALPEGYDTALRDGGAPLSGGQRQRVALARAVYGRPRLVILDEPNSNLDLQGEAALVEAMARLKRERATMIVVTHRPNLLVHADLVMILDDGAVSRLGPRDEVLPSVLRPVKAA